MPAEGNRTHKLPPPGQHTWRRETLFGVPRLEHSELMKNLARRMGRQRRQTWRQSASFL